MSLYLNFENEMNMSDGGVVQEVWYDVDDYKWLVIGFQLSSQTNLNLITISRTKTKTKNQTIGDVLIYMNLFPLTVKPNVDF